MWRVKYRIADVRHAGDIIAVIYDYMAGPRRKQFKNLECFDLSGHKLWTAEHPTDEVVDVYVNFFDRDVLTAWKRVTSV